MGAFVLSGCATTFKPTPGNTNTSQWDFDAAKYACQMEVQNAASGRSVRGPLIFLAVVIAANIAADHALYKSCMRARGFTPQD